MYYAQMIILREDGYLHFALNQARPKLLVYTYSTFTIRQAQNTESDKIKQFKCILCILTMNFNSLSHIQCILVKVDTLITEQTEVFLQTIWL